MEIHTRFNIGDKVYLLKYSSIMRATISDIRIDVELQDVKVYTSVTYLTSDGGRYNEGCLFESKEELVDDLLSRSEPD